MKEIPVIKDLGDPIENFWNTPFIISKANTDMDKLLQENEIDESMLSEIESSLAANGEVTVAKIEEQGTEDSKRKFAEETERNLERCEMLALFFCSHDLCHLARVA